MVSSQRASGTAIVPQVPMIPEAQLDSYTYSPTATTYGSNIPAAWAYATGLGVTVGMIDDGFTPSLLTNFNSAVSRSLGAPGLQEPSGGFHGTTTSAEIGGSGANGEPIGIAPNATMALFKVDMGNAPFSEFVNALTDAAAASSVVNNSWGFGGFDGGSPSNPQFAAWYAALQTAVARDRGGLGDAIVFAAGNDRADGNDIGLQPIDDDPRVIAVAATNLNGTVASFSNPGAGLLVSALGVNVTVSPPSGGYAYGSGTSYSAPTVSAIVAMMLQADPKARPNNNRFRSALWGR
ncbi:MAG TPA: S8 family serine peptidase [Acidisphaera sp.]|nr:S8 family serine peptidase [Acidisphaera sp.]